MNPDELFQSLCNQAVQKDEDIRDWRKELKSSTSEDRVSEYIERCSKIWAALDDQHEVVQLPSNTAQSTLPIPQYYDLFNPSGNSSKLLTHERVPNEQQECYFAAVGELLSSIPSIVDIEKSVLDSNLWCSKAKKSCDEDPSKIHSTLIQGIQKEKNYLDVKILAGNIANDDLTILEQDAMRPSDRIYSIALHSPNGDIPLQRFDLFGRQPLAALCDTIHCVQQQLALIDDCNPIHQSSIDDCGEWLLLDGVFYVDDSHQKMSVSEHTVLIQQWLEQQAQADSCDIIFKHDYEQSRRCTNLDIISKHKRRRDEYELRQEHFIESSGVFSSSVGVHSGKLDSEWLAIVRNVLDKCNSLARGEKGAKSKRHALLSQNESQPEVHPAAFDANSEPNPPGASSTDSTDRTNSISSNSLKTLYLRLGLAIAPNMVITVKSMHTTSIAEAGVQLGKRQLFMHLGNCEHFVYVYDCHYYHRSIDLPRQSQYPRVTFQSKMRRRKCGVCEIASAALVAYGDRLADQNPAFFCRLCYNMLHYSQEGELLYDDFAVYPYLHDFA